MTIGPATVIASVNTPVNGPSLVKCTYVIPLKFSGTTHPPLVKGANAVPPGVPPFTNPQNVALVAVEVSFISDPAAAAAGAPAAIVSAGKGVMRRFDPEGHDLMNPAARVKTARMPRGVSKGEGTAATLEAVRMNVWWRASTVTISAATVRIAGFLTRGAAPRYLHKKVSNC
jgi:hypothetical protein